MVFVQAVVAYTAAFSIHRQPIWRFHHRKSRSAGILSKIISKRNNFNYYSIIKTKYICTTFRVSSVSFMLRNVRSRASRFP